MLTQSLKQAALRQRHTASSSLSQYARCYFSTRSNFLIETSEVEELIAKNDPNVRFVNASWYMPGGKTDPREEHQEHRLTKETQYFSISECVKPGSDLPNTMPPVEVFTDYMRALRVGKDNEIVCYDHLGMFTVARFAWLCRFYGATNVRIMNGGLQKWIKEGRDVYSGPYTPGTGLPEDGNFSFVAKTPEKVTTDITKVHDVAGQIVNGSKDWQITDARAAPRFNGEVEEPRNMRAGHISGSINVPFASLVDAETGCLKSDEQLKAVFDKAGIDYSKKTIHSCGSGVTACTVQMAYEITGGKNDTMYDGSWSEYGRSDEPDFSKKV